LAKANSQAPSTAKGGLTSSSDASAARIPAAAAIDNAESAFKRAATSPTGIACVHSQPTRT
jgi:hypothetical protein